MYAHTQASSQGTMTFLEVAAFDPLFFIHHASTDRIFALWQQLHPTLYVTHGEAKLYKCTSK